MKSGRISHRSSYRRFVVGPRLTYSSFRTQNANRDNGTCRIELVSFRLLTWGKKFRRIWSSPTCVWGWGRRSIVDVRVSRRYVPQNRPTTPEFCGWNNLNFRVIDIYIVAISCNTNSTPGIATFLPVPSSWMRTQNTSSGSRRMVRLGRLANRYLCLSSWSCHVVGCHYSIFEYTGKQYGIATRLTEFRVTQSWPALF